ncbi:MAG: hypothetical protein ACTSSF_00040 [Candidatus Heimdallarchaeaceae archaeon]
MNQQEIEARRLTTLIKQWAIEIRTRCSETEDPEECKRLIEQLLKACEKFERLINLIGYFKN